MKNTPRKPNKKKGDNAQNAEMQAARGRLKGLLNNIMDDPESLDEPPKPAAPTTKRAYKQRAKAEKDLNKPYLIKLFDRYVNITDYDENSPLYPICRQWFYDHRQPRERQPESEEPTYYRGKEALLKFLQRGRIDRVVALPPPTDDEVSRIPYCEPPQMENGLNLFTVDYDWDDPQVTTEDLTASYLDRWKKVRHAWNLQSQHYSDRYAKSAEVLEAIKKN